MQRPWAILGLAFIVILAGNSMSAVNAQDGKPKPLADGILVEIPTNLNPRDMFSLPIELPDLNPTKFEPQTVANRDTLFGQSRRVIMFRENVWQYEFAFTGLRQARLKIPTATGVADKNVWYMLVRIRNTGKTLTFDKVKQNPDFDHISYELQADKPVADDKKMFMPIFTLEGSIIAPTGDGYQKAVYQDVVDPVVVEQIRMREDPNQPLLDTYQLSKTKIPLAKNDADPGVWSVVVWEDVDPRIDFVSVFVQGLTNAFRLSRDVSDASKLKTLQLNFWRAGDSVAEANDSVVYGIPLVDDPQKQVLICERYDLPGPLIRGYFVNDVAKREVLVVEADAKVNLKDFQSALIPILDQGKLPPSIGEAFAAAGITLDKDIPVTTVLAGNKWSFQVGEEEYNLALEPQYWEPDFGGIRFIKSLDHIWIYR